MVLDFEKLNITQIKLLNKVSIEILDDFDKLVEKIYNSSNKNIGWITSSLLSRNPYLSEMFINLVHLVFIKETIDNNRDIDLIILLDRILYKPVQEYVDKHGYNVKIKTIGQRPCFFRKTIKGILKNSYYSCKLFFGKVSFKEESVKYDESAVLIDVFWDEAMFSNGTYSDKYYGGLQSYLTKNEKEKVFYLPHLLNVRKLKYFRVQAKKAELNVIFKHDYLKFIDYFYALTIPFRMRFNKKSQFVFWGFNIKRIILDDFFRNRFNTSSFYAVLNYRFVRRFKDKHPNDFVLFINWFENQVIDRGLNKGFHDFFENVLTKGYQGFIVSYDYNIYLRPTVLEMTSGVIPKEINVCGKMLIEDIKKYNSKLKVKCVPAFRFSHLWDCEVEKSHNKISDKHILVILPFVYKESAEIINVIKKLVSNGRMDSFVFNLKLHPDLDRYKIETLLNGNTTKIQIVEGSMQNLFKKNNIVIGNTSSACVEALAEGIPVIIIGSKEGITQNPIPIGISKKIWKLAYEIDDIETAINQFSSYLENDADNLSRLAKEIKSNYFEPVSRSSILDLLELKTII